MQRRTALVAVATAFCTPAFALYDAAPNPVLVLMPGAWTGTLTYRDWSRPDRLVTLPCKLSVAFSAPDELALFYVFDDGPGKVVYSYERMRFDFTDKRVTSVSGIAKPTTSQYEITSATSGREGNQVLYERAVEGRTDKYTLSSSATALSLSKVEHAASGVQTLRNKYEFRRGNA